MHRTVDDKTWFVMFYSDTRPTINMIGKTKK